MGKSNRPVEELETITKHEVVPPKRYKVLIYNDDYTTMEFVVFVLQKVFHKSLEEATEIMLKVHSVGVGLCGIYSFEVAESKVQKVLDLAKVEGHPLKCTMMAED